MFPYQIQEQVKDLQYPVEATLSSVVIRAQVFRLVLRQSATKVENILHDLYELKFTRQTLPFYSPTL